MFEKFTQKAIDVVQSAQNFARDFKHTQVSSCHLLLGLVQQIQGVQAKILDFGKINISKLSIEVQNSYKCDNSSESKPLNFSSSAKEILELSVKLSNELNSKYIMPEHIFLAILKTPACEGYKILKKFEYDEEKILPNLKGILDKSSDIKTIHPEIQAESTQLLNINNFFEEKTISQILKNAQSKLSTQGYEILGSEQILQSILENPQYKITSILEKYGITTQTFSQKLSEFKTRSAEFENSDKQIIFTPNAFQALLLALDCAKESGSVEIGAQHVILGILKSKKGIAYKILSQAIPDSLIFEETVLRNTNDKIPETLAILRLAKKQALELNSSTIGTEMILLGILCYGLTVGYDVLKQLGITFKDARSEVEKLIKPQSAKVEISSLTYTERAKKLLEVAYETAKEHKRTKIKSENLLYGMTKVPDCLAMNVLTNLGADVLEIRQGIKQALLGGMEL